MIAVDTNILVYAHRSESTWHQAALASIRSLAENDATWMIPFPCLHEFLAVVTNPRLFTRSSTLDEAIDQVDAWKESPSLVIEHESRQHWPTLKSLLRDGKTLGGAIHDVKVIAICLDHGVREVWTADRDFNRFPQLRTRNPLVEHRAK